MSGVTRENRVRNEYVRCSIIVASIENKTRENRLKWFRCVLRREKTNTVKVVMKMNVERKRERRPKKIVKYD